LDGKHNQLNIRINQRRLRGPLILQLVRYLAQDEGTGDRQWNSKTAAGSTGSSKDVDTECGATHRSHKSN
jgi:hypothetical protein